MNDVSLLRQLRSFILPVTVVIVAPFLLVGRFRPFGLWCHLAVPVLQIPLGVIVFCTGLVLVTITVRLFSRTGAGTLAPWDPPRKLVTQGIYRHVRNPMISGVLFMLLGEAAFFASWALLVWAVAFFVINTIYFILAEEPGLERRFGASYATYKRNVPRWIPRVRSWKGDNIDFFSFL
jgi:protein-S-isoprenylcysteine O-methyltransferase Ste14